MYPMRDEQVSELLMKTGTTTVGLVFKDGVVLAADRKVSAGIYVAHKAGKKILPVDKHAVVTIAGVVADAQAIVDILRANASLYRISNRVPMPIKAIATLASNILFGSRLFPYIVEINVAGYDLNGPSLYTVDLLGSLTSEKYIARGSGSPMALGVLEKEYRPDLSEEEAVRIAVTAVRSAIKWDPFSGEGIDLVVVKSDGYRYLGDEKVKSILGLA